MVDFKYFDARGSVPINTKPMQEAADAQAAAYQGIANAFNHSLSQGRQIQHEKAVQKSSQDFQSQRDERAFAEQAQARSEARDFESTQGALERQNRLDIANAAESRRIAAEDRAELDKFQTASAQSTAEGVIDKIAADPENPFFREQPIIPFRALYQNREPEDVEHELRQQLEADNPGLKPEDVDESIKDYMRALQKPRKSVILPGESHEGLYKSVLKASAGENPTPAQEMGVRAALDAKWGTMPHDAESATKSAQRAIQDEWHRNLGIVQQIAGKRAAGRNNADQLDLSSVGLGKGPDVSGLRGVKYWDELNEQQVSHLRLLARSLLDKDPQYKGALQHADAPSPEERKTLESGEQRAIQAIGTLIGIQHKPQAQGAEEAPKAGADDPFANMAPQQRVDLARQAVMSGKYKAADLEGVIRKILGPYADSPETLGDISLKGSVMETKGASQTPVDTRGPSGPELRGGRSGPF